MAVGDKLVTLDGLKAVYQDVNGNVNDLKSASFDDGVNLIPHYTDTAERTDSQGITWSCEDGVFTLNGSTSSIWFATLAGSTTSFPDGIRPGDTLYLEASALKGTNVYIGFRPYSGGTSMTALLKNDDFTYTVPSDATGLVIRLEVPKNRTIATPVVYRPVVRKSNWKAQMDSRVTALETGADETASEVQEYIESNDSVITTDNARNIIPSFDAAQDTVSGITYSASNGDLSVSGKATAGWYIIVAGDATNPSIPDGMAVGETYFFWLDGPDSLRLSVFAWPGGSNVFETSKCGWFTIPAGTTGIQIRVRVPNGQTVPNGTVVHPYVGRNIPNISLPSLIGFKNPAPMLTIIDDDGNSKFYTKLLPVITEKNVPITSAVVCGNINTPSDHSSMTWDQVVECYQKGAEIVSHTLSHLTGDVAETLTEPEIEADYRKARHTLASHGIHSNNILVYAGNSGNNANCVEAAKRVYDYAIHSAGNAIIKQDNFKPYYIQRYGVSTSEFVPASGQTVGTNPKTYIDSLVTSGGWMVWMLHTSSGDWTDDQVNGIKAAIDYAVGQGVQIVTCEYALKQFVKV